MKNRIKYLIFSLLMVVTLALCACGKKADTDSLIPEEVASQLPVQAESLLKQLYEMNDIELEQVIQNGEQNGQTAFVEGVKNFKETKELVGDLVSIDDTKVFLSEGNYVVKVDYSGKNRKSELSLGFDSNTNQVAIFSVTPKYSVMENMEKAALNTVLGMGTVFIILIFISFLISLFKYISIFENKIKAKQEPVIETKENNTVSEPENLEDDLELVAVITAVIAEFSNTDASNLIVRSIKRVKR